MWDGNFVLVRSSYVVKTHVDTSGTFYRLLNQAGLRSHTPWPFFLSTYTHESTKLTLPYKSKFGRHTNISDRLNLHGHTLGQLLDRDTATRRLVRKVFLEDAVHLGEVRHVVEEDVDLRSSAGWSSGGPDLGGKNIP